MTIPDMRKAGVATTPAPAKQPADPSCCAEDSGARAAHATEVAA